MAKRYTKQEWAKTPYAGSDAKNPDAQLMSLLAKYRITTHQVTHHLGPNGRAAVTLRFVFRGRPYRVGGEVLDVINGEPARQILQVKRWIYWYLKGLLELVDVFGPAEQLMLGFLENGDGGTVYQAIESHIASMPTSKGLLAVARKTMPALPAPPVEGEEV